MSKRVLFRTTCVCAVGVLATACGDSTAPVTVATLDLTTPATLDLELRDSAQVSVVARDAAGNELPGRTVSWTSSDAGIASVDADGWVMGLAPGTATVTAAADGGTASVSVTVEPWNIADDVIVIDSTTLAVVSDSAERATGTYRFQVLAGQAPAFAVGDVVVGTQFGGYLRRVLSVSVSGSTVTLETEQASLSDVIQEGTLQTTIDMLYGPSLAPPRGGPLPGEVVWGAPKVSYMAPGVVQRAAGFSLDGLDVCKLLKENANGGDGCPDSIDSLVIEKGTLDFDPHLDFGASFSGFSLSDFHGVADGTLSLDFAVAMGASVVDTLIPSFKIVDITRPFYLQLGALPVLGYVDLTLAGGIEVTATAKGSVSAGFHDQHTVKVGAKWSESAGWQGVFDSQRQFDATLPSLGDGTLSGQVDLGVKAFIKPGFKIIFYGVVGPFADVEPYGKVTLTFGTQSCGLTSSAGVDSEIGFTIPFLDPDVGNFSVKQALGSWPGKGWDCPLGTLDVSTITNGQDPDPDGYTLMVDTLDKGPIGSTDQRTVEFIPVGERAVKLDGVADNCTVQGTNPQQITVVTGGIQPVAFTVDCAAKAGDLQVSVSTSGQAVDPDGYTVTVDGSKTQSIDVDGQVTFAGLAGGTHDVALSGLAANCAVDGSSSQSVTVKAGAQATAAFTVYCTAGELDVRTSTSGTPSTKYWTVTVDGSLDQSIGPNGSVSFTLAEGDYSVALGGVPGECTVTGSNPQTVHVPASGTVTATFDVTCPVVGLTVNVATSGDPSPVTSYIVDVDGSTSTTVGINGSVTFSSVSAGTHSVGLQGAPDNCTVQGANPRDVSAPGSVTFDVVCQAPIECTTPPWAPYVHQTLMGDSANLGQGATFSGQIISADYGHAEVSATAASPAADIDSWMDAVVEAQDYVFLVPVDPTRADEFVTLRSRVVTTLQRSTTDYDNAAYSWGPDYVFLPDGELQAQVDTVFEYPERLTEWGGFQTGVSVQAETYGGSATSSGKVDVSFLDVRDKDGNVVPIAKICTASGHKY